ncbi:type 4a pilus biogenesis protein PilO [Candidatus Daviesbacteria bacterium]|nr:type 4a pilus biogenesis protein PilO [Candidatus Daviesbacteria bacterium]
MTNTSSRYSRYFTYIKPVTKLPILKNYGPTIFTLLTISILIFFAIKPTVETILVLQKKSADSEEVLQKITQKANNLSLARKNYDNLSQDIKDKTGALIPNTVTLKSIIQDLENTAKAHDASVSALQIQPLVIDAKSENSDESTGTLSEITFTFNTEGSYQNLIGLLQDLKMSSRLISINSLSLSKSGEGATLIMSLSGKTYYLK